MIDVPAATLKQRVLSRGDAGGEQLIAPIVPSMAAELNDEVVVLLLVDFVPSSVLWGWSRLVLGSRTLRDCPGLRFAKVLGSGFEGGFGLRPSRSRQGLFAVFINEAAADAFIHDSPVTASYRERANEYCAIKMIAFSARGSWDRRQFGHITANPTGGPIAALTRASVQPRKALAFWRYAPAAQVSLDSAPGCQLAVGLGEAPLLRQATFSVWDSVEAMDAYARSGAHLAAIRAAHSNQFFSESMFVRYFPLTMQGNWKGRSYALENQVSHAG